MVNKNLALSFLYVSLLQRCDTIHDKIKNIFPKICISNRFAACIRTYIQHIIFMQSAVLVIMSGSAKDIRSFVPTIETIKQVWTSFYRWRKYNEMKNSLKVISF